MRPDEESRQQEARRRPARAGGGAPRRRPRWGVLSLAALLHLAALFALARAFAPDFTRAALETAGSLVSVELTPDREPEPEPEPDPVPASEESAGEAGEEGREAAPREVTAPVAPLPRPQPAPPVAGSGAQDRAGAAEQGLGSGAGGTGEGTGSGGQGDGRGSGARPLEMIAGSIDNARDYPTPPGGRRIRRGHDVVIELVVNTDGRVESCRVTDPSPDPEADAITCRLARERFVFRPRLNAAGEPVKGIYRWRQRWF